MVRGGIDGAERRGRVARRAVVQWGMSGNGQGLGATVRAGSSPQKREMADNDKGSVGVCCHGHRTAGSSCRCSR